MCALPKPQSSGTADYIKLTEGAHRVRIVSAPVEAWTHFLQAEKKSVPCAGRTGCGLCQSGNKARKQHYFNAIERVTQAADFKNTGVMSAGVVKLLIVGSTAYEAIYELSISSDWGFEDVPHYDMVITRKGTTKSDTQYFVTPCAPKELSEADTAAVKSSKDIREVVDKLLGIGEASTDDGSQPTPSDSENPQHLADRMPKGEEIDASSIPW
jgi:hypothetical protein